MANKRMFTPLSLWCFQDLTLLVVKYYFGSSKSKYYKYIPVCIGKYLIVTIGYESNETKTDKNLQFFSSYNFEKF